MKYVQTRIVWLLVAGLIIVHQDFWNWNESDLLLGLPIGLTYHVGLSIAAAVVWWLACLLAWPETLDDGDAESSAGEGIQ